MIHALFIDWFNSLDPQVRPYWGIAIVMSIIFLIQMVLTFIGIGDTDTDVDFGADIPDGVDIPDGHADTLVPCSSSPSATLSTSCWESVGEACASRE